MAKLAKPACAGLPVWHRCRNAPLMPLPPVQISAFGLRWLGHEPLPSLPPAQTWCYQLQLQCCRPPTKFQHNHYNIYIYMNHTHTHTYHYCLSGGLQKHVRAVCLIQGLFSSWNLQGPEISFQRSQGQTLYKKIHRSPTRLRQAMANDAKTSQSSIRISISIKQLKDFDFLHTPRSSNPKLEGTRRRPNEH